MGRKIASIVASSIAFLGIVVFGTGVAHADTVCYNTGYSADGHSAWTTCNYVNGAPRYHIWMNACNQGGCTTQGSYIVPVGQQAKITSGGYLSGNIYIVAHW